MDAGEQMSHERVHELRAVCKKDATGIFKKCAKTDEGKTVTRMTQVPGNTLPTSVGYVAFDSGQACHSAVPTSHMESCGMVRLGLELY